MRNDLEIILASGSPRRKELLEKTGIEFQVKVSPAEEIHDSTLGMAGLCETNARLKAEAVAKENPEAAVIGSDTLVFVDDMALGKPKDMEEARGMIRRLSGRSHKVCTGVCIAGPAEKVLTFHQATEVVFKKLNEETITSYLEKTQPLDKAGAYGIQDHGEMIVEGIVGDFDNVMGLPVKRLLEELEQL
ncbi:MAG: Maf family protein [Luteolibacter sp.]